MLRLCIFYDLKIEMVEDCGVKFLFELSEETALKRVKGRLESQLLRFIEVDEFIP